MYEEIKGRIFETILGKISKGTPLNNPEEFINKFLTKIAEDYQEII